MGTTFDSLDGVRPYKVWDGAVARAVRGDRITLAVIDLEPNAKVPEHHHPNEQLGIVLKGSITMIVAGESRTLEAGDTYVIPGDVPHAAEAGPDGVSALDAFNPPREDWEGLDRLEPGPGAWPS
jgi:quercetin dioxygenase-like cupin family protein